MLRFDYVVSNCLSFNSFECLLVIHLLAIVIVLVSYTTLWTFSQPLLVLSLSNVTIFVLSCLVCTSVTIPFPVSLDVHSTSASFNTIVLFTQILIGAVSLVVLVANRAYLRLNGAFQYEYDLLLILSIIALFLICWASDFLTMYIAIELLSLSFYSLVGLNGHSELSVESAIKYFILGSIASCILLFGISLVYADCGTIVFADFVSLAFGTELLGLKRLQFGFCLILIALLFKLGLVPFHMWLCDVYEGAMSSLTLFFATLPKLAIIFFVVKLIYVVFPTFSNFWGYILFLCGLASATWATIAAVYQKRIKRILAYSAISHVGLISLALSCNSLFSIKSSMVYILLYVLMSCTAFFVLVLSTTKQSYPKYLINWLTCYQSHTLFCALFALTLFSIAGIPPLAGFFVKFNVMLALFDESFGFTLCWLVLLSCLAGFYYLRIIKIMLFSNVSHGRFWVLPNTKEVELIYVTICLSIVLFSAQPLIVDQLAMLYSVVAL